MDIFSIFQMKHSAALESTEILRQCHFDETEARLTLLHKLKNNQRNQARLEESVFYSLLKAEKENHPEIIEAFNEHHIIGILLQELEAALFDIEGWNKKMTDLKQLIERHVEKETYIFTHPYPQAVQDELAQLVERMETEEVSDPLVSAA